MGAPYAIYITLMQLVQMLVGMFVTIKAVMYQAAGEECHVNKTNSVLGLAMYASYFVLFFKLFVDNYYLKPKATALPQKRPTLREVARSVSRKMTQVIEEECVLMWAARSAIKAVSRSRTRKNAIEVQVHPSGSQKLAHAYVCGDLLSHLVSALV